MQIAINILPNISWSKDNQTMKFGRLIEYNQRNIFFKVMQKIRLGDPFQTSLFLEECLYEVKPMVYSLFPISLDSPRFSIQLNKLYKTLIYWSRDTLNFEFFRKMCPNNFSTTFLSMIFQEKYCPYHILLTDKISLSDCLYLLRDWAICVLQLLVFQGAAS